MFVLQLVTSFRVFEVCGIEVQNIEIAAMMVAVAVGAAFIHYLFRGVVALVFVSFVSDVVMAIETLLVRNVLSKHVALGAVSCTFQVGMRIYQLAWRNGRGEVASGCGDEYYYKNIT